MHSNLGPLLKILCGPAVFVAVYLAPMEGLSYEGQVTLATFVWAVFWWMARPIPWGITALLPLFVFPVFQVMSIRDATGLYGQRLFFWLLGISMLGYALEKHGVAKRIALVFLRLKGVANSTAALTFMYMFVAAILSWFIADAGVIAMMMPIGMSLFAYISSVGDINPPPGQKSRLASFLALGTLYGAVAGGVGTLAGGPHNVIAVALSDSLAGEYISWFRWMKVGVPLSATLLVTFWLLLRFFFPPEISRIPGGSDFIQDELRKLGKLTRAEINVLVAFGAMVLMFTGPSIVALVLGAQHPLALYLRGALATWVVPPTVLILLFLLPVNLKKAEGTLVWNDVAQKAPWNIIFLCTSGVAMADALMDFGVLEYAQGILGGLGIGATGLPFVAAGSVVVGTNLFSGTAAATLFCSIFIPAAMELGFNPVSIAILVTNLAVGILFPWSGASAGTAFASGYLDMKEMIKVGVVGTAFLMVISVTIHFIFAPIL
ncbi:MAG: SLC13 family permease [Acidobacteriota bacterium]|nr:SLC13 family permease [Acidobacteriota bacterium]